MTGWRCYGWAWFAVLGLLLVTSGGLWAQQPKAGGTLRVAWEADITGLDPHTADPALPTIATIIKTQLAKIGVDVTLEVVDRPIFLRRLTTTKEYDQVVNFSSQIVDPFGRAFVLDSRQGANVANHKDPQVDALLDRLALAPTAGEFSQLGRELQEYLYQHMIYMSATSLPSLQAARDDVQGYVYERGFKVRFEATWLDK